MDIGKKIKDRRQALGLTLEQVGDACGVGKSTVRKWELGMIQNMRRDKLAKLAEILQVSPVELIDYQSPVREDEDIMEIREALRRDPEMRVLFSAAAKVSPEHIKTAAAMLKALEPPEFSE